MSESGSTNSDADFVRAQLHFFLSLCRGHNLRCIEAIRNDYVDFRCAFHVATTTGVPADVRALFVDLIIGECDALR